MGLCSKVFVSIKVSYVKGRGVCENGESFPVWLLISLAAYFAKSKFTVFQLEERRKVHDDGATFVPLH